MSDTIAEGFRDVDRAGQAAAFVNYLDTASAAEEVMRIKRESLAALGLREGQAALDVGCGLGGEVQELARAVGAQGRAVGLDLSEELLEQARARVPGDLRCEFVAGDVHDLPFADGEFDAVRVERVLLHVEDPERAMAEMARVLRPGGTLVAAEPDFDTFILDGPLEMTRRVLRTWAQRIRHPDAGRRLAGLALGNGLEVRGLTGFMMPMANFDFVFAMFALRAVAETLDGGAEWLDDQRRRGAEGRFFAALSGFMVVAAKPGG